MATLAPVREDGGERFVATLAPVREDGGELTSVSTLEFSFNAMAR